MNNIDLSVWQWRGRGKVRHRVPCAAAYDRYYYYLLLRLYGSVRRFRGRFQPRQPLLETTFILWRCAYILFIPCSPLCSALLCSPLRIVSYRIAWHSSICQTNSSSGDVAAATYGASALLLASIISIIYRRLYFLFLHLSRLQCTVHTVHSTSFDLWHGRVESSRRIRERRAGEAPFNRHTSILSLLLCTASTHPPKSVIFSLCRS